MANDLSYTPHEYKYHVGLFDTLDPDYPGWFSYGDTVENAAIQCYRQWKYHAELHPETSWKLQWFISKRTRAGDYEKAVQVPRGFTTRIANYVNAGFTGNPYVDNTRSMRIA